LNLRPLGYEHAERCRNSPGLSLTPMLASADDAMQSCLTTFSSFRGVLVTITVTRTRPVKGRPSPCHLEAEGSVQVAGAGERIIEGRTEDGLVRCGCCTLVLHRPWVRSNTATEGLPFQV